VFYLLRIHDIRTATLAAAALNGAGAAVAFFLAARSPHVPVSEAQGRKNPDGGTAPGIIYVAIGISGLSALSAEVVWTRLLSLLLGGTVYTFAVILAVFLVGIGLGSHAGTLIARGSKEPRAIFGWCQILVVAAVSWTAFSIAKFLPYWPIDTYLPISPSTAFELDVVRCLWAAFPATVLWGASFPLALRAAASEGGDPGRLVGGVYAANTVGAIAGALGTSLLAIPILGTRDSQRLILGLSFAAGLVLLLPPLFGRGSPKGERRPASSGSRVAAGSWLAAAAAISLILIISLPEAPWELIAYGRRMPVKLGESFPRFVGEGMNSSVAVSQTGEGWLNFHVSGKVVASSDPMDMRIQNMLGHLPAMLHPDPKTVLVVGCGAGVTAGAFVLYPGVERIVVCEIEPLIPETAARFFGAENNCVLDDPRVEVVVDDARHFILKARESFDIITSDPIHPWLKGSAALYSEEYFELCRKRLNPGGIVTQWVPLYESTPDVVRSELATFFRVFPEGTVWSNDLDGLGYDVLLLGHDGSPVIDADALQRKLTAAGLHFASRALSGVGLGTAVDLLSTYAGRGPDLKPWLRGAEINRDRNMRLQYLAGMGLDIQESWGIFDDILRSWRYPDGLIRASGDLDKSLREALRKGRR
jgi:spermidine synthase